MNESGLIHRSLWLVASFLLACGGAAASTTEGVAEETGLRYWEWQDDGILFRLTQRLPDQTRAFFLARGFDRADADFIATQCVFQSMFKNTGTLDGEVVIDLENWEVRTGQGQSMLMTRDTWRAAPELQDAPAAAMIALEWSLLPTHQTYEPNDYNWGMTSYGLPPGSTFDLEFSWSREARRFSRVLTGVECPADIDPQPEQSE